MNNSVSFLNLQGEELFFLKYINKGKHSYNRVLFFKEKKTFESHSYTYTIRLLIKKLIKEGVLKNGHINSDALERFIIKYDESYDYQHRII